MALSVLLHVAALAALVAATWRVPGEIDRTATVAYVSVMPPQDERPPPVPGVDMRVPEPYVAPPMLSVADSTPLLVEMPAAAPAQPVVVPVARPDDGPPSLDAAALSCVNRVAPTYPPQSRRMREEGTVDVRIEININGNVADAQVTRSSGHPRLDAAALESVRQWHCEPARRGGRNVGAVALQSFEFTLQRR
jgi:protein TonB